QAFEFQPVLQNQRDRDVVVRLGALVFQVDAVGDLHVKADRLVERGDAHFQVSRIGRRLDGRAGNSRAGVARRRDGGGGDVDGRLAGLNRCLVRGQAGLDQRRGV